MVDKLKIHRKGVDAVAAELRRAGAADVQIEVIGRADYVSGQLNGSRVLIRVRATGDFEAAKFEDADYPQDLYLAYGAEHVGEPEIDETAEVRWVPVEETPAMIARGDILGQLRPARCATPR